MVKHRLCGRIRRLQVTNNCGTFMDFTGCKVFHEGRNMWDTHSPCGIAAVASTAGPGRPVPDKYAFHVTDKQTNKQMDIAIA